MLIAIQHPRHARGGKKIVNVCRHGVTPDRPWPGGYRAPFFTGGPPADGQEPRRHNFGEILRPGRPERRKTVKPFESSHRQRGLGELGPPDRVPRAAGTSPVGASRQVRRVGGAMRVGLEVSHVYSRRSVNQSVGLVLAGRLSMGGAQRAPSQADCLATSTPLLVAPAARL